MSDLNPRSTVKIAGHPIHPMLIPFPIVFFVTTLVTDILFLVKGDPGWARASMWLLGAGLVMAALAALAGLTDFLSESRIRAINQAWMHMIGNVIAVVLEAINLYLRYKGGETDIAPVGVILSLIVVLLLLFNGWMGWELVYRHRVGVADRTEI